MWNRLFAPVDALKQGMDAAWLRGEVISHNIANVDTPGFKASRVEFEEVLKNSLESAAGSARLKTTREKHFGGRTNAEPVEIPVTVKDEELSYRYDGNNVDIEAEMALMARNTLHYYTMVSKLNSELERIDMAIRGQ